MTRIAYILLLVILTGTLWAPQNAQAQQELRELCTILEETRGDVVTLSVKYGTPAARDVANQMMNPSMHLDFISRMVGDVSAVDALTLCDRDGVPHMELIAGTVKDVTLHRLLEIYRLYTYILGGMYPIAAVNFSQGVRPSALGQNKSGERTVAEALDAVARRGAPVFVAAGNSPAFGLNPYARGEGVFPVVATESDEATVFSKSSTPPASYNPKQLFLFAKGAPRPKDGPADEVKDPACRSGEHLTVGQLLQPETAAIEGGGSSFATFAATASACYVQQYLQIVNTYLSVIKAIGDERVTPFVSYYIDNPISEKCSALEYRLADKRKKYVPEYEIDVARKTRLHEYFSKATVEFNLRYSTALLRAFYQSLPALDLVEDFRGPQRLASTASVVSALKKMTLVDWVRIAANKQSLYYPRWVETAAKDGEPVLDRKTIDKIVAYCRHASLYVVLSDTATSGF